jgi:exopolysaccharide biosynthesis predicted pyruvyltransferase EpsI
MTYTTTAETVSQITGSETIKQLLHEALAEPLEPLKAYKHCALLNYPNHYNIGDHLIWLGAVFYLTDVLGVGVKYASSIESFSEEEMEKTAGKAPIVFIGGGNLGDVWMYYLSFYQKIISKYRDRPIIILPQSIHFRYENRLNQAKEIFNAHPNLTLIARENRSHEFALEHFPNCKVRLAPDMALQTIGMPDLSLGVKQQDTILYLCRSDQELNSTSSPASIDLPNVMIEDWASYRYKGKPKAASLQGITQLLQEGWQQGTLLPHEWVSRQMWQQFHPYSAKFKELYAPAIHRKSWSFMHNGVYQFQQHKLLITNRLHGHLLGVILGIPHIFLANAYHKNQSVYETWTHRIPFCRFVSDASQIEPAARELLSLYSR